MKSQAWLPVGRPRILLAMGGVALCALLVFVAVGWRNEPLTIGFLGEMTGRASVFSQAGRNGVILALEQANEAGGVHGRPLRLVVSGYHEGTDDILMALKRIETADAEAIVGPMTSAASMRLMSPEPVTDLVMFSPTSETSRLAGIPDRFFRIAPASSVSAKMLANHVLSERGLRAVAIVRDTDNDAFTRDWFEEFAREFEQSGGRIVEVFTYSSRGLTVFGRLAERVAASGAEGVLLLTHAADTALFCQQVAKKKLPLALFCTSWASSPVLIAMGGRGVEGLTWVQGSQYDSDAPAYREFVRLYRKRFNCVPDYAALHAYEAAGMLLKALRGDSDLPLEQRLLALGTFYAPQDALILTDAGDVIRDLHLLTIRGGEIVSLAHSREPFTSLLEP